MVVASQGGKDFGVGYVLEVGVVLTDELCLVRGWDQNARGEVGGFENGEAVDGRERVGVQGLKEIGCVLLCVFPFFQSGWQVGV